MGICNISYDNLRNLIGLFAIAIALLQLSPTGRTSIRYLREIAQASNHDSEVNFCKTRGSLHELAFTLANFSSPVGSPSFLKMQRILDFATHFYMDVEDPIFLSVRENMAAALEGYGLHPISTNLPLNSTDGTLAKTIYVEMSVYGFRGTKPKCIGEHCGTLPRIILQAEQLIATFNRYRGYFQECHQQAHCMIWDFSDNNYRIAAQGGLGGSFFLLPIMIQTRLGQPSNTQNILPLSNRTNDITHFGLITRRRAAIKLSLETSGCTNSSNPSLHQNQSLKITMGKSKDINAMRQAYENCKVCFIIHSYHQNSSVEYHRLSELAPFGCVPVIEDSLDVVGKEEYQRCGGVIFAQVESIQKTACHVLSSMGKLPNDSRLQYLEWWNAGIRWNEVLVTLFPKTESILSAIYAKKV